MTTPKELIDTGRRKLVAANDRFGYTGEERNEARRLLVHALGAEIDGLQTVPAATRRRYETLIERRATGEPMAYITGTIDFLDMQLSVRPGGFIPRATTEFMAEQAIRRLRGRRGPVHVDLATGIGPVALAVAKKLAHARVYGVDLSRSAVSQARRNAERLHLFNATFHVGDLFAPLPRSVEADVVTIHPPYVAQDELATLPVEIRSFEPRESLTDQSSDGLYLVGRVAEEALDRLRPRGWLLIEVSRNIARPTRSILVRAGYRDVKSTVGALKYTRVLVGRTPR